jgi:hypothetical protein
MIKQTLYAAFVIVAASASSAFADDHTIRPQCWDENVNGEIHHHCDVHRNAPPPSEIQPGGKPAPPPAYAPPPQAYAPQARYGPPGYSLPPWAANHPFYPPPLPFYWYPEYIPPQPPSYPAPPTYYGYGPSFGFRFGPFSFWVP